MDLKQKFAAIDAGGSIPQQVTLNLAIPLVDQEYCVSGDFLAIWQGPDAESYIDVKFNSRNDPAWRFVRGRKIETPFRKIYVTTPAGQAGDLVLIYGTGSPELLKTDSGPGYVDATLIEIRDQLRGDLLPEGYGQVGVGAAAVLVIAANADRKGFDSQADIGNTGTIYIGYTNAVTAANCVCALVAGVPFWRDDYRGPIWARASAAGQLLNYGEV